MNKRPSSAHLDALSRSAGALAAHHLDSSTIESLLADRQKASVKQGCQLILFEMALVMAGAISAGKLRDSRPARHD